MIELVIEAQKKDLGGGLEVGRILPFHKRRMVGPFIFLDHMGPADFLPGQGVNVRPHPHIGLATVTYLFHGEIFHQDSLGYALPIRPGEVNWMTAGRGIVHSERTDSRLLATGALMHGMQAWVALPLEQEEVEPGFDHYGQEALPTYEEGGIWARLIAGEAFGARAAVKTHSPMFYIHWELQPGARTAVPEEHEERAIYVAQGTVEVAGREFNTGEMVVFEPGPAPTITALTQPPSWPWAAPTSARGSSGGTWWPRRRTRSSAPSATGPTSRPANASDCRPRIRTSTSRSPSRRGRRNA